MATVQVRAIDKKESKLGLEKYGLTRSPGSGFYVEALTNPQTGGRSTGLNETEASALGKLLNVDLGPFSTFWDSFRIKLEDKTLILDTDSPIDQVRLSVLKQSKYVAPSESAWRTGKAPEAIFVVYDANEEVRVEKAIIERSTRASAELQKMLTTKRKWLATSMFKKSYENMDPDTPFVDLGRYISQGTKNIDTFLKWLEKSDDRLEAEYLINLAVIYNALRRSGNSYIRGDHEIGHNLETAIDYIMSPSKQETRLQIENEIASKMNVVFRTIEEPVKKEPKPAKA